MYNQRGGFSSFGSWPLEAGFFLGALSFDMDGVPFFIALGNDPILLDASPFWAAC